MSGLAIFVVSAWAAFVFVVVLGVAIHRSHQRERSAQDLLFSHAIRVRRAKRRRDEVERWNRRSVAIAGEFEA